MSDYIGKQNEFFEYGIGEETHRPKATLYMSDGILSVCIVLPKKLNKFQQFMYKLCFGWEYTEGEYHE